MCSGTVSHRVPSGNAVMLILKVRNISTCSCGRNALADCLFISRVSLAFNIGVENELAVLYPLCVEDRVCINVNVGLVCIGFA